MIKIFQKKYIGRWVEYDFFGIKLKLKVKPSHIDTINLVLDENYGIGNRIFSIVNIIKYCSPKKLNIFWDNKGWVNQNFEDLFRCNFDCEINEYQEIQSNWKNSKNERTIYFPQASLITPDRVERTLAKENITNEIWQDYRKIFSQIFPCKKTEERVQKISLPETYVALQIRNAPDWDRYNRNESLEKFLYKINEYPKETVFYLSSMNKETSDYIKNNVVHKIIELPQKDYKSMYDAIVDLYVMSKADEGIYSYGSTFGELAWWLSDKKQKYTIIGSPKNWKWINP